MSTKKLEQSNASLQMSVRRKWNVLKFTQKIYLIIRIALFWNPTRNKYVAVFWTNGFFAKSNKYRDFCRYIFK